MEIHSYRGEPGVFVQRVRMYSEIAALGTVTMDAYSDELFADENQMHTILWEWLQSVSYTHLTLPTNREV